MPEPTCAIVPVVDADSPDVVQGFYARGSHAEAVFRAAVAEAAADWGFEPEELAEIAVYTDRWRTVPDDNALGHRFLRRQTGPGAYPVTAMDVSPW